MTIDDRFMGLAMEAAAAVRHRTSPNPWVGSVLVASDGTYFAGATSQPGGLHAERMALNAAAGAAKGGSLYTTLEPCDHTGRTGPCTEAIIEAGVKEVVVGIKDPDPLVAGSGIDRLTGAGIEVRLGVMASSIETQLAPYLHHRRSGRPWVVMKLAASADGRTAAPDGSSQWITGAAARIDAHRLRAESDAILVGAGTVRADDPSLTVRDWPTDDSVPPDEVADPRRVVLGAAPAKARVHPCLEWDGPISDLLERLGSEGVVQLMVEGGAGVAHEFHTQGLVDQYVIYMAPALFGGNDSTGLFHGAGAPTIADVWRGEFTDVRRIGDDLRIDMKMTTTEVDHPG